MQAGAEIEVRDEDGNRGKQRTDVVCVQGGKQTARNKRKSKPAEKQIKKERTANH